MTNYNLNNYHLWSLLFTFITRANAELWKDQSSLIQIFLPYSYIYSVAHLLTVYESSTWASFNLQNHTYIYSHIYIHNWGPTVYNFKVFCFVNISNIFILFMYTLWNHPCGPSLQNVEMSEAQCPLSCCHLWLLLSLAAL